MVGVVAHFVCVRAALETRSLGCGGEDMEHIRTTACLRAEGSKPMAHIMLETTDNPQC